MARLFPLMIPPEIQLRQKRGETFVMVHGIPWQMIAPHEATAYRNHRQGLSRLAARGGLNPVEALAVLMDVHYEDLGMDEKTALQMLFCFVNVYVEGVQHGALHATPMPTTILYAQPQA